MQKLKKSFAYFFLLNRIPSQKFHKQNRVFVYFIYVNYNIMTSFSIEAQIRAKDENCKHLRKARKLPAVVYGKTQEATSLTLDASEFLKLFRKSGESNIINLKFGKNDIEVLVHNFQKDPVSGEFTHVDFFALTRGEKLKTMIHLNFTGVSEAVKEGAVLEELQKEIEVSVLPKDLVDHIDVDISVLKEFDSNIKASELNVPTTMTLLTPAEEVIIMAAKPKKIVEETNDTEETTTEETPEA
jgi:large subunit ribosomal protein L25